MPIDNNISFRYSTPHQENKRSVTMNMMKILKAAALGLVLACASGVAFADDSGLSKRAMQQCQMMRDVTLVFAHNYADADKANRDEVKFSKFMEYAAFKKADSAGERYLLLGLGHFIVGYDENMDKTPEEIADYLFEICKDEGPGQVEQDLLNAGEEAERYLR